MKSRSYPAFLIVAAALLISSNACATTETAECSVNGVAFDKSTRLIVHCGSSHYYGFDDKWTGCTSTTSMDVLKTWESMAVTALLSGKKLKIGWDKQGGAGCGAPDAMAISHVWILN